MESSTHSATKDEPSAISKEDFQRNFDYEKKEEREFGDWQVDKEILLNFVKRTIPIIDWLPKYDWRKNGPNDLVAGLSIGMLQIPQGLGYALIANVPPAVGLYMSIFPMIPYFMLSTSRHNSMGMFAVICLLVGKTVAKFAMNPNYVYEVYKEVNGTDTLVKEMFTNMEVATSMTFYCAIWQLLLYALRLGVIFTFMSDGLVSSFLTGAGVHILTLQLKEIIGVNVEAYHGIFNLPYTYGGIAEKIWNSTPETRSTMLVAIVISAISISLLVFTAFVLKPWLKKYTHIPIPIELILVVVGIVVSSSFDLPENCEIREVGKIPYGLPLPIKPHYFKLLNLLLVDSFVTSIVAFAVSMSMAQVMAEGEDYVVDPNQELLAMGVGNLFGSYFSCITFSSSLSRSVLVRDCKGQTQVTGLVSCLFMIIVVFSCATLFETLPKAILASIIVTTLFGVFAKVLEMPDFWRRSHIDGIYWLIVFFMVVVFDVDVGLVMGFILSAGTIFMKSLKADTCLLGRVPNTDYYLDKDRYKVAKEVPGLKIVHYRGGLNFATRYSFRDEVIRLTEIDPKRESRRRKEAAIAAEQAMQNELEQQTPVIPNRGYEIYSMEHSSNIVADPNRIWCIILDLSAMNNIDPAGSDMIKSLAHDYKQIDITVCIAGGSDNEFDRMKEWKLFEGDDAVHVFTSVHDAVVHGARVLMGWRRLESLMARRYELNEVNKNTQNRANLA
ncbi:prestin-like [Cloeon dipterum]|uniref:prestin-like n=1 Tax=Cloeon dipterum TaxID=197152 RepID=UPI00321FF477